MASVISAWTVAWRPGLFHRIWMSKASSSRAFSSGGQAGQDVPGERELVEQGRVGGPGGGRGQGGELGVELLAFGVQVGEPGADPAAQRGGGGVGRVGGELFEFEDAGVLGGVDLPAAGR